MILQALKEYYDRKAAAPNSGIAPLGWEWKEIPFLVVIDSDGKLVNIEDTRQLVGNKKRARPFLVPKSVKRTSGIEPYTLWDNIEYALGIPSPATEKHVKFLAKVKAYETVTIIRCVEKFLKAEDKVAQLKKDAIWNEFCESEDFIAFKLSGDIGLVTDDPAFKKLYNENFERSSESGSKSLCLISAEIQKIADTHPSIKGVSGTNSSGGNVVSFNFDAVCSYGHKQGHNAPIGERSAFAYTTALNTLLGKDSRQKMNVGDATVVFWTSKDSPFEDKFADAFSDPPKDDPDRLTNNVAAFLSSVKTGAYQETDDPTRFHVLGLAPNSARISVRFWHVGTVAEMSERFAQWFEELMIAHGPNDRDHLSLFHLFLSVAAPSRDKKKGPSANLPPNLAGNTMRSILEGLPLPETLLQAALRRIKAEKGEVTYPRAKLIKACLNRKIKFIHSKERMLTVALDKENTNIGYRLGRLFAVLERIQEAANPRLNATIRDKYYASASATPAAVFGTLMRLAGNHLSKLRKENPGWKVKLDNLVGEITYKTADSVGIAKFPAHLKLDDQGQFAIGYYHQRQDFFTNHERQEKDNGMDGKSERQPNLFNQNN